MAGFVLGTMTGLVIAAVDATRALLGPYGGSKALHALAIFGFLVPVLALAGTLTGVWFRGALRLGNGDGFVAGTWRSSVAALPFVAFALWVPSGWLREYGPTLPLKQRALAAVALLMIAMGVLVAARLFYALWRRRVSERLGPAWMTVLLAMFLLIAAGTSWADAVLYQGDYEDFHYGLAWAFIGSMASASGVLSHLLPTRWTLLPSRLVPSAAAILTAAFGLVLLAPSAAFSKSNSLVFKKLVGTARSCLDLDGDGNARLLGGGDCSPFDARVSRGAFEVPENGLDEDCSGKDASWPAPPAPVRIDAPAARPNVVLITVDTLRADHLGVYGYERPTSPVIDRFAERSLVFTDAYSQAPKTSDSVPSLMTGTYPSNVARDGYVLTEDARPLAVVLRAAGYATCAGISEDVDLYKQGFDSVEMGDPTRTALRFLEAPKAPFFLWLHYMEPHIPYVRQKEHDFGASAIDRYDGEIAAADARIGQVLEALEKRGLERNTVVIVTADHGEEFLEHGGRSHTRKLYRELLHVPLIVRVPGMPGRRIDGPVELVDVAPTLAELTGVSFPRGTLGGESLLGAEGRKGQTAYAEDFRAKHGTLFKRTIFDGRYRLIDDRFRDRLELYDDEEDPREQRDIAQQRPDIAARLFEVLSVHALRRHTRPMARLNDRADASTWRALLPTFRHPELLLLVLDRVPKARAPELDAALRQLLSRRHLDEDVAARVHVLLGG